jgi:hypothetical protein
MTPESPVFGSQRGLNQRLWDFSIRNQAPEGAAVKADRAQRLPGAIQEFHAGNLAGEQRPWERHERESQPGSQQEQNANEC